MFFCRIIMTLEQLILLKRTLTVACATETGSVISKNPTSPPYSG